VGVRSILDRQLAVLAEVTPHIMIVGGSASGGQATHTRTVSDRIAGAGALGGLYTALVEAQTEQVLVIACDMPFLTAPFLRRLAERAVEDGRLAEATVPRNERGAHPLCASYARAVAGRLEARIEAGRLRVIDALSDLHVRYMEEPEVAPFDPDGRLLLNVNTPLDYERARALA
jgi:molybdopterin-guanine dinucleotide biosynthesis protein A